MLNCRGAMKISLDEILAGLGMSIVAYFAYKTINDSKIKKVDKLNLPVLSSKASNFDFLNKNVTYEVRKLGDKFITVRCEVEGSLITILITLRSDDGISVAKGRTVAHRLATPVGYSRHVFKQKVIDMFKDEYNKGNGITTMTGIGNLMLEYDTADEDWLK